MIDNCIKDEEIQNEIKPKPPIGQDKCSNSTEESSDIIRLHSKKKLYDQAIPVEERRNKEDKDILRLSESSSIQIPKEKEDL